jgi:tellurite resistance protein
MPTPGGRITPTRDTSLTMGSKIGSGFLMGLGGTLLALTTALIALLAVLTVKAIAEGKVFVPE